LGFHVVFLGGLAGICPGFGSSGFGDVCPYLDCMHSLFGSSSTCRAFVVVVVAAAAAVLA
jgi:hypothetical protein